MAPRGPIIPLEHRAALRLLLDGLAGSGVDWALTGSMSFAVQGVTVTPHDIDVQTDETGAYEIARLFVDQVTRPVRFSTSERMQSHFGALLLAGIEVEVMGTLQKRLPGGDWEAPVDVCRWRRWVLFDGLTVPVLDLEYECRAYAVLGRVERAALLRRFLDEQEELE